MSDEIRKRPLTRRRAATASAPVPASASQGGAPVPPINGGSTCGHMGCENEPGCKVRYVGPMSHIRDHHAMHAARGIGHMWAASIITGFAVVVTGVVAFQSVQAKSAVQTERGMQMSSMQVVQLNQRLERLEQTIQEMKKACQGDEAIVPSEDDAAPSMMRDRKIVPPTEPKKDLPTVTEPAQ